MSALGLATLGVQCSNKALGMASLGVFCDGVGEVIKTITSGGALLTVAYKPAEKDNTKHDDDFLIVLLTR